MKVILSLMFMLMFVLCKKEDSVDGWTKTDTVVVDSLIDSLSNDTMIINHEVIVDR